MIQVRRLGAIGAVLALVAVITCTQVLGGAGKEDALKKRRTSGTEPERGKAPADDLANDLAATKFAQQKVVVYQTRDKDLHFGWQVKSGLKATEDSRPRDFLILVDTSASQNRGPLLAARKIAEAVVKDMDEQDSAAVWTVNVEPKPLTPGFVEKGKFDDALKTLAKEYPSGSANLKKTLQDAVGDNGFAIERGRRRVILYLGDGMSVAGPLSADDRADLCGKLVKKGISFFSVPLGSRFDPLNLHGLPNATGGTVVRCKPDEGAEGFMKSFKAALDVPILYPQQAKFSEDVLEVLPANLPPLRTDVPTLVVGRIKENGKLSCSITGIVQRREVKVELTEELPGSEADNFFLATMFQQWRQRKEQPAILQADRALAFTYERNILAREELIAQAEWALEKNELAAAQKLYDQALQLDPDSLDARSGQVVARKLREGKLTREELKKMAEPREGDEIVRMIKGKPRHFKLDHKKMIAMAQPDRDAPPPRRGEDQPLEDVRRREVVEDQRNTDLVEDAVREARRLLPSNPDAAQDLLKRTREALLENPDISNRARRTLAERLQAEVRNIRVLGTEIKRRLLESAQQLALARERDTVERERRDAEDRVRERMRAINELMARARYEIITSGSQQDRFAAVRAAEQMRNDLIKEGQPIPPALTAAYGIAQADFHLTELTELRRLREQRWLSVLLEVERSFMPFPDEPPIQFPPAAKWKALTRSRKSKYGSFRFGASTGNRNLKTLLDTLSIPRDARGNPTSFDAQVDPSLTLGQVLSALQDKFSRPGDNPPFYLTFEVDKRALEAEGVTKPPDEISLGIDKNKIPAEKNISLSTYLQKILNRVDPAPPTGLVFVVKKETELPLIIENFDRSDLPPPSQYVVLITTTQFARAHKETVGYAVSDLVVPIPNAINVSSLQQQATLFGQFGFSGFGGIGGGLGGGLGGGGQGFGGFQGGGFGGFGGFGGGGFGGGGFGGLGGGLGGGGLGGGGLGGGGLGGGVGGGGVLGAGQAGVQGQNNFGVGGGQQGLFGGQLGQFGNLGGQFGFQGGTQEGILILTIRQLIGEPSDWAPVVPGLAGPGQIPNDPGAPGMDDIRSTPGGNQLGYFPSALALVVKATSRVWSYSGRGPSGPAGAGAGAGMGRLPGGGDVVAVNDRDPKRKVGDAGEGGNKGPKFVKPKDDPGDPKGFKVDTDSAVAWQEALDKGEVSDPGLIVATADYLMQAGQFDHAVEFLKANLRRGVVVKPWVYETLAIALRASNGSAEEIERAETSLADLEPQDAEGFLKASKAMADHKRWDRALAFCRQAALLEPGAPKVYADALNYAEMAKDVGAMEWAAGNLLKQDWPVKGDELHRKALDGVDGLSKALDAKRSKDVERLQEVARKNSARDLVIRLGWGGEADLDLRVDEPTGSVCSCVNRLTVGGGTLLGDTLGEKNVETYVNAEAFPGKYKITVDKVWGRPLGDKAQLKIVQHQGTDKETSQLITLNLAETTTVTIDLAEGRRTEVATVPPESLQPSTEPLGESLGAGEALSKLRGMASGEITGTSVQRGFRGGVGSLGGSAQEMSVEKFKEKDREALKRRTVQNRVSPFVNNNVSFTSQAVVDGDRRSVRLNINPIFNVVTSTKLKPIVSSVIPGAGGGP